jgi:hypothetical protein
MCSLFVFACRVRSNGHIKLVTFAETWRHPARLLETVIRTGLFIKTHLESIDCPVVKQVCFSAHAA